MYFANKNCDSTGYHVTDWTQSKRQKQSRSNPSLEKNLPKLQKENRGGQSNKDEKSIENNFFSIKEVCSIEKYSNIGIISP